MGTNQKKLAKKRPKPVTAEQKAVEILQKHPQMGNSEISRKLKGLGLTKDEGYVRKRMTKSDYLKAHIDRIREANQEMLSRRIVPLALREHERVLRDKSIPKEKKFPWIKLAEDKEFGADDTKRPPAQPQMINLVAIQQLILKSIAPDNVIDINKV